MSTLYVLIWTTIWRYHWRVRNSNLIDLNSISNVLSFLVVTLKCSFWYDRFNMVSYPTLNYVLRRSCLIKYTLKRYHSWVELGYERTSIHTEDFRYIIERRPTIELQQINTETRNNAVDSSDWFKTNFTSGYQSSWCGRFRRASFSFQTSNQNVNHERARCCSGWIYSPGSKGWSILARRSAYGPLSSPGAQIW